MCVISTSLSLCPRKSQGRSLGVRKTLSITRVSICRSIKMFRCLSVIEIKLLLLICRLWTTTGLVVDCECGRSFTQTRILGGRQSDSRTFPWMAALVSKSNGKVFCGGSLINSQFVLTAGHCMINQNTNTFTIVIGETDVSSFSRSRRSFVVSRIVNHPLFSGPPNYSNDLALIQLNQKMNLINSTETTTICLPNSNPTTYSSSLIVSGWGFIANGGPQPSRLQEASVQQRNQNYCQRVYGSSKFSSRHLCASGTYREGVCNGDSGGPLILRQNDKNFLIGVVSYGVTCGDSRYPAVFTRTQPYLPWIFSVTKNTGEYCSK